MFYLCNNNLKKMYKIKKILAYYALAMYNHAYDRRYNKKKTLYIVGNRY